MNDSHLLSDRRSGSGQGHGEPARAGRRAVERRPHWRQAPVLAGAAGRSLDRAVGLPEGALDKVGVPVPMLAGTAATVSDACSSSRQRTAVG
jgi:hypothetical protein